MPIINRIAEFAEDMATWRRHLHQNPELEFECHETAAFVEARLREFGVDSIETGIAKTGLVAVIKGNGGDGPVIGLRADMDALPIQEVRDLPYKSLHDGKMHACGHDGHTAMLLGAARYLSETRNFAGSVALIFQPAEESGAGANVMCNEGVMDRYSISQVYGIHNFPGHTEGQFVGRPGAIMAAADQFEIIISGKGAHAAMPHQGIDATMIAVQMAQALQLIVSREVDPLSSVVLSITQIHAGTAYNIIPETAQITGTVRTLDKAVQDQIEARMRDVVEHTARAHGASVTFEYDRGYPVTVNDAAATEFAARAAADISTHPVDLNVAPVMGAEDFSFMLEQRKGAYLFLGQGGTAGLHHPEYDFNDEIAPVGASYFVKLVEYAQPAQA